MTQALPCDDIKKKILIIDYECLTAHEGKHGLQLAREWKPDLIILDIMLPGQSGMEVCRAVRPHFEGMICKRL